MGIKKMSDKQNTKSQSQAGAPHQGSVEPYDHVLEHLPPNEWREEDVEREGQRQEDGHSHHLRQTGQRTERGARRTRVRAVSPSRSRARRSAVDQDLLK